MYSVWDVERYLNLREIKMMNKIIRLMDRIMKWKEVAGFGCFVWVLLSFFCLTILWVNKKIEPIGRWK